MSKAVPKFPKGWRVFPIEAGTKVPISELGDGWQHYATDDPEQIAAWAKRFPSCNWAVACGSSSLGVVDVDPPIGEDSLFQFELEHEQLPATREHKSARGGRHLIFSDPERRLKNTASKLGPKIDTRGGADDKDGYIVIPPSTFDGNPYTVTQDIPVAPLPQFVADAAGASRERVAAPEGVEQDTASAEARATSFLKTATPARDGSGGNAQTYAVAAEVRGLGISEALCLELMAEHYNPRCQGPWDYSDLAEIVTNAYHYAQNDQGCYAVPPTEQRVPNISSLIADSQASTEAKSVVAVASSPDGIKTILGSDDDFVIEYERVRRDTLRYVQDISQWRAWSDGRWRDVSQQSVWNDTMALVRNRAYGESNPASARKITSKQTVSAVEQLARGRYGFITRLEDWDRNGMILNTPGGTVDLNTGKLREADPRDLCSKSTTVTPSDDENCPTWKKSLKEWTQGDTDLQAYLKRIVGYSLTGDVSEHMLAFLLGVGRNGKGTFQDTIKDMMGDYATTAPTSIFIESRNAQHPTELAHLVGSRIAFAEEINEGQGWAEAKLKQLTGGGRLVARKMRGDFFEFQPTFKLFILANHTPRLHTVDEAIRSRLHLVPFDYVVPAAKRDTKLREKLKAELPGILRWGINGCLEWQKNSLNPPAAVIAATDEYVRAEDPLADWMERCCEKDGGAFTSTSDLYRSYMANRGEGEPLNTKTFSAKLRSAGLKSKRTETARGFLGIRLKPTPDVNPDGGDIADEF